MKTFAYITHDQLEMFPIFNWSTKFEFTGNIRYIPTNIGCCVQFEVTYKYLTRPSGKWWQLWNEFLIIEKTCTEWLNETSFTFNFDRETKIISCK